VIAQDMCCRCRLPARTWTAGPSAHENTCEAPRTVRREKRAEVEERPRALLDRVGLADRAHHYPSQLSGGSEVL
jgi:ABC-type polar amino acid transport system ATPase subunit